MGNRRRSTAYFRLLEYYVRMEQMKKEDADGKEEIKETIHAKGIDIGIYTTDFKND